MNLKLGFLIAMLSWGSFVGSDILVKIMNSKNISAYEILFFYAVGNCIVSFSLMRKNHWQDLKQLIIKTPHFAIIACLIYIIGSGASIKAFGLLPVPDIYIFFFTAPIVTFMLARITIKEEIPLSRWFVVIMGLTGVIVSYYGNLQMGNTGLSLKGIGFCFICVGGLAVNINMLRHLKLAPQILSFFPAFVAIFVVPFLIDDAKNTLINDFVVAKEFIIGGMLLATIGTFARNQACSILPASIFAVTHYFQLPVATIAGFLIWGHLPTLPTVIGSIIIISSGMSIVLTKETIKSIYFRFRFHP